MNMRALYDPTVQIPEEVIKAAYVLRRWVDANVPSVREVTVCGVGVRTFLSVKTMLDEHTPNIYYTELVSSGPREGTEL